MRGDKKRRKRKEGEEKTGEVRRRKEYRRLCHVSGNSTPVLLCRG
jgi:hypothetical protein